MAVVDTLVTRYVLDESGYLKGAGGITGATARIVGSVGNAAGIIKGLAIPLGAAAGAVLAGGGMALKAASDWEVLNSQLQVITGSAERAAQVAKFADDLAKPSAFFDTAQLAETAKLLETMQLKTERFLPIVSTMGSLFGQSQESLMSFASALGRIKAGSFGEGFERLREYGIAAADLAKQGVNFKNGEFQLIDGEDASQAADRALAGVEAVVKDRFGNMDAIMGQTFSARVATLGEMFKKSFRIVGDVILKDVKGPFDSFTTGISNWIESGALGKLAEKFSALFDWEGIKNGALSFIASVIAGFEQLPSVIDSTKALLVSMWDAAKQALKIYISYQAAAFSFEIIRAVQAMVTAFKALKVQANLTAVALAIGAALKKDWIALAGAAAVGTAVYVGLSALDKGQAPDMGKPLGFDINEFKRRRDEIEKDLKRTPEGTATTPIESLISNAIQAAQSAKDKKDAQSGPQLEMQKQTGYLEAIERNTNPIQNQILGGGSIGAMGVTPQELGRATGRGKLDMAVRLIAEWAGEAQAKSGADFLKMANPFIGGR